MSKRFIDTDVFKKQFMRDLKPAYKLLWLYITTDCNHAGIWEVDFEVAQLRLGQKIDSDTARKVFKDKIVVLDGGSKWFIPSFIEFQYGQLSDKNRAHHSVISILNKYSLLPNEGSWKPLTSSSNRAMDMDMDKEQEKDKDKEEGEKKKIGEADVVRMIHHPFSHSFDFVWQQWINYKKNELKFVYKTVETEQIALNDLIKLSKSNEKIAIEIVMKSIASGWKGFFPLKTQNNTNGSHQPASSRKQQNASDFINDAEREYAELLSRRTGGAAG